MLNATKDNENQKLYGRRQDGRNLVTEWRNKSGPKTNFQYVQREKEFRSLEPLEVDHVLGTIT